MMTEKALAYIESRLVHWGDWYSRGNTGGLGYPSKSIEYRFMTEGHIERNFGSRSLPVNESAEEIEKWVVAMMQDTYRVAEAIRLYYCYRLNQRDGARKMSISPAKFNHYLALGKHWLMGRLRLK